MNARQSESAFEFIIQKHWNPGKMAQTALVIRDAGFWVDNVAILCHLAKLGSCKAFVQRELVSHKSKFVFKINIHTVYLIFVFFASLMSPRHLQ